METDSSEQKRDKERKKLQEQEEMKNPFYVSKGKIWKERKLQEQQDIWIQFHLIRGKIRKEKEFAESREHLSRLYKIELQKQSEDDEGDKRIILKWTHFSNQKINFQHIFVPAATTLVLKALLFKLHKKHSKTQILKS